MQTTHTKLLVIRASRKRWQTRLTRATNMLGKLARQERRLLADPAKVLEAGLERELKAGFEIAKKTKMSDSISWSEMTGADLRKPEPERPRAHARIANLAEDLGPALREAAEDQGIPAFLDRSNPVIAEEMTAKRKAAEAEARKAMPLSGRDALKAIKRKK